MCSRGALAAPRPIRTAALPPLNARRYNPFLGAKNTKAEEESTKEEQQVREEVNRILTLPALTATRIRSSFDLFGVPYKKTPSPNFKRPPSRPSQPLVKDPSFQQLSSISEASTCVSWADAYDPVI